MTRPSVPSFIALLALAGYASAARSAEYCVACTGPDAAYGCVVEGSPPGAGKDPRAQFICITELAAQGGHESCSVARNMTPPCQGEVRMVSAPLDDLPAGISETTGQSAPMPEGSVPAGQSPDDVAAPGAATVQAVPAAEQSQRKKKGPRTVEELAKQTVQSSKEGIEKAGDAVAGTAKTAGDGIGKAGSAVGNAAKKTWNCLVSLFNEC